MGAAVAATIPGIHHVTCITGDVQKCVDFYVGVLGLRFVKKSINQDLPDTYHIYFGDYLGTPGTAMTFRVATQEGKTTRFETGQGGPHSVVDVIEAPEGPEGEESIGTVHHVAWRTPDPDAQVAWRDTLLTAGRNVTPVIDRWYFKSIYFREPGGVLFEIATDGPGFTVDESPEELGTGLSLPPWFQVRRDRLDEILPPIVVPTTATTGAH